MPAVACVVLLGALGACGSGTQGAEPSGDVTATAEPTPTVTPSPEPSPSPSQTDDAAPPRPAAMDRTDGEGAAAAAQYFLSLYPYIMRTGDTTEWDAMTGETCEFCSKSADDAQAIASTGDTYSGGSATVEISQVYALDTLVGGYPVDIHFVQEPAEVATSDGAVRRETPAEDVTVRVELLHVDAGWLIIGVLPKPEDG